MFHTIYDVIFVKKIFLRMFIFLVLMSNLSQSRDLLIKRPQTERGTKSARKNTCNMSANKNEDVNDKPTLKPGHF